MIPQFNLETETYDINKTLLTNVIKEVEDMTDHFFKSKVFDKDMLELVATFESKELFVASSELDRHTVFIDLGNCTENDSGILSKIVSMEQFTRTSSTVRYSSEIIILIIAFSKDTKNDKN